MSFWIFGQKPAARRLAEAQKALGKSRFEAAEKLLGELVKEGFEPATSGYFLAQSRYGLGRHEEAFVTARNAADAGSSDAMFMVHQQYMTGQGTGQSDAESMRFCFAAADAGSGRAAFNIAAFSVSGAHGFTRDHREAVRWYERAMDLGHSQAGFNLGMLLVEGDPEIRNRDNAARAFLRSAQLGFPTVETLLEVVENVSDEQTLSFLVATACAIDPSIAPQILGTI